MDYKVRTRLARVLVDDAIEVNSEITVLGWVRTIRISKSVAFVEVNDGSCMGNLQAVFGEPEKWPILEKILTGASVRIKGKLIPSQGKGRSNTLNGGSRRASICSSRRRRIRPKCGPGRRPAE